MAGARTPFVGLGVLSLDLARVGAIGAEGRVVLAIATRPALAIR
jgi:hypothetical protein